MINVCSYDILELPEYFEKFKYTPVITWKKFQKQDWKTENDIRMTIDFPYVWRDQDHYGILNNLFKTEG